MNSKCFLGQIGAINYDFDILSMLEETDKQ